MKMQRRPACARRTSINVVAQNRETRLGAMYAQLMGTARKRLEREPRQPAATPHYFPRCRGGLALRVRLHPPAARFVQLAEWNVDAAFVLARAAFDHSPIGLADLAVLEQLAEQRQCLAMAAEHQAAGGVAVEPVRERGVARQSETQSAKIVFEADA